MRIYICDKDNEVCVQLRSFVETGIELSVENIDSLCCNYVPSDKENIVIVSFISQPQSSFFVFPLLWKVANIVSFNSQKLLCFLPAGIIKQASTNNDSWKAPYTVSSSKIDIKCNDDYMQDRSRKSLYRVRN